MVISQEDLVDRLMVDKASVSRSVVSLEKKGCLSRVRSSDDRRESVISLTESGVILKKRIAEDLELWMNVLQEGIPPEEWDHVSDLISEIALKARYYSENM